MFLLLIFIVLGALAAGYFSADNYSPPDNVEQIISSREALQFALDNDIPLKRAE